MQSIGFGLALVWGLGGAAALANELECGQSLVEQALGVELPETNSLKFIEPMVPVQIIYQWNANNGYCGEASLISAGLANGQYMSQADARLACGAFMGKAADGSGPSLLQGGEMGASTINYNAQMLLENAGAGVSGDNDFGQGARCAANSGLDATTYPFETGYKTANIGESGVQDYLSWIKAEMIAGHQVTIGVLGNGGDDQQYDHIVTVVKIGTNHDVTDPRYYPDDVLYFDDHGLYSLQLDDDEVWDFTDNPAVPVGAGGDDTGCTPYLFAYTFDTIAKTREAANQTDAPAYSLIIPASEKIDVIAGNTAREGDGLVEIVGPHNYALSVRGPLDMADQTQKVSLEIVSSRSLDKGVWTQNPRDPIAGFNYESPYMSPTPDGCDDGECFTNTRPEPMQIELAATVHGLVVGQDYTLYEFAFPALDGSNTGRAAAIPAPVQDFELQASKAANVIQFTAKSNSVSLPAVQRMSNQIIMFRAVQN
jgi:hypothetical protein